MILFVLLFLVIVSLNIPISLSELKPKLTIYNTIGRFIGKNGYVKIIFLKGSFSWLAIQNFFALHLKFTIKTVRTRKFSWNKHSQFHFLVFRTNKHKKGLFFFVYFNSKIMKFTFVKLENYFKSFTSKDGLLCSSSKWISLFETCKTSFGI
jgi:hypothetical protein